MHTYMHMRSTLILKDELVKKAQALSKINEKTALVHEGLKALIEKLSRQRLIDLGGSDPKARLSRRRR